MKRYSAEEVYPKNQLGKCMVYFNMSHHYRRIYSAKPRVDTNLSKKSSTQFCCSSPDVFNFVRRNCLKQPPLSTPRYRTCTKNEEEHKLFKPKILESRAESKLRSLPVYQPPQRLTTAKTNQAENEPAKTTEPVKTDDNKGEEKKQEEISTKPDTIKVIKIENKEASPKIEKKEENGPGKQPHERHKEDRECYRPLNKSTVMFLKDITDDILQKGIYTNKSLEKLFFHHISKNKYSLPKDLMEQEVARLKMELEMPIEEEKYGPECSSIEDEEVLTALDSLLLPASIRDQVASSLGLKRRPPPLPSPKDSFTGSLALTSMSEAIDKEEEKSKGTFTLKCKLEERNPKLYEEKNEDKVQESLNNKNVINSEKTQSDDDKTIADEDYSEEVISEHKSIASEAVHEESSQISEIKSEASINTSNAKSDNKISSGGKIETKTDEDIISEIKGDQKDPPEGRSDQEDDSDNNESDGESSDLSSIHTE